MPPKARPYRFTDLERWTRAQVMVLKTFMAYLPGTGLGADFKQNMRDTLAKITGAEVDLWLDSVTPVSGREALKQLPDPACLVVIGLQPTEHRVVLDVDLRLAGMVVDKMLGGTGEDADPARPLSSIERGMVGFVLLKALHAAQSVLAEEQQVALRLLSMQDRPAEVAEHVKDKDQVLLGFKIFLDMQVAYARLLLPAELVRTTLAAPTDPSGPVWQRRLDSVRQRLPRINGVRTHLSVEAGRSELTQADLEGVDVGDILVVEQTQVKKEGDVLSGAVEIRVGDGRNGLVRANLVELEGGGMGVEVTAVEPAPEPVDPVPGADEAEQASPQEAADEGGGEDAEEQAWDTPLRPRGGAVPVGVQGAGWTRATRVRGMGGDARDDTGPGEHQVDEEYEEEQQEGEGGEQEEAAPDDNLQETEALLNDVPLPVVIELGRIKTTAGDVVKLRPGQILELRRSPNDPVDITVNGKLVGKGELVEVEGELGVRLLSLVR